MRISSTTAQVTKASSWLRGISWMGWTTSCLRLALSLCKRKKRNVFCELDRQTLSKKKKKTVKLLNKIYLKEMFAVFKREKRERT